MTDLTIVVIVAVGTLAMRASLVAFFGDVAIPPRIEQGLRLVAPAVLAGLVAQGLFADGDTIRTSGSWYVAALVATLVAWKTRSITLTLIAGMAAVWVAGLFL